MKKELLLLPCISTMAIASIARIKTLCSQHNVCELTADNVEALSQTEGTSGCKWKRIFRSLNSLGVARLYC